MKLLKSNIFWSIVIGITVLGCARKTKTFTTNYALLYSQVGEVFQPQYIVYHSSKDSSHLHFQINSNELLYARKDKSQPYFAKVSLHYELYDIDDRKTIIDSATHLVSDETKTKEKKKIFGKLDFQLPFGKNYNLYITAKDENRNAIYEYYIGVDKSNSSNSQFFMMLDQETDTPLFENYTDQNMHSYLKSEINAGKQLFANFYIRNFAIATPPFSSKRHKPFDYIPDSISKIAIDASGISEVAVLDSGFVHFSVDTTQKKGFTYYTHSKNYPKIHDAQGMIDPLRYITSKTEYENMLTAEDPREGMEHFWLTKCGSKERAREIIKQYYNRVQNANTSFSSYIEGWKTDRGMISLVFGLPRTVRKFKGVETWYYGDESNIMALQFSFTKVSNPFSENDYKLQRAIGYKSNWYKAVDAWRSGRIYWAK